ESLREEIGRDAIEVLDTVAERMDADGATSIDRSTLSPPAAVDRLVDANILVGTSAGHVRPFHQVVTDTRLALRVAKGVRSAEELRAWIGDRSDQDLHKARRLRLATTVIAARDERGARMLDAILADDSVRPLTKHAILMGLAAVDEPRPPIVDLIRGLLDDERRRASVARTVVYDHEGWMDALEDDLDRYWETWPDHRDLLLQLLAAVSVKRGEKVTAHLERWKRDDPDLLDRARLVFWHDPAEDCDAQFEMRLQSPFVGPDSYPIDWSEFMARMPLRAVRLLAASLKRTSRSELTTPRHEKDWMYQWPDRDSLPEELLDLGAELLATTRVWWAGLNVSDVEAEGMARYASEDVTLVRVVDLLARAAARSISVGELDWAQLAKWAPSPPRMLDAWLFLRIGAALEAGTPEATADGAAAWFARDPVVTEFLRNAAWAPRTSRVAREFLLGVARRASPEVVEGLRARANELPDVPESEARSLPAVEPAVSVEEASNWTPDEWIAAFRRAKPGDDRWQPGPDGRPVDTSRAGIATRLSQCASRDPDRFLAYAREFATRERALPAIGRRAILEGLSNLTTLDRVEPSELESLILRPEYRNEPECSDVLAQCVHDRADHDWSDSLLRRLGEIADEHASRNTSYVALHALARVAEEQPARRALALDVIEPLIDHLEPSVRAGSAEVAIVARSADPARAIEWVLRVAEDMRVASDARVAHALRWIAVANDEAEESASQRARDLLTSLARSSTEDSAALGGASLLFLLHHGVTSRETLEEITTSNPPARLGAARTLASWLNDGNTEATDQMKNLAVAWANDDDPGVRRAILGAFLGRGESPLLDDRELLAEIVRSKAVGDDKGSLLDAFDRRGTLLPLEEEVRTVARRLLDPDVSTTDPWLTRYHAEKACEMLSRLIEEAERERRLEVRDAALDAWDALLEAAVPAALSTLSAR
ncbi:MAG: hypothetical protein ACF8XB_22595, partial [Planctomycetota bacterium JB042]